MMRIEEALRGVTRLGFDTSPLIHYVDENPQCIERAEAIMVPIFVGTIFGITSLISLVETLIIPIRFNDLKLQQDYRELLLGGANMTSLPVSVAIAESAAMLRARYNLRTPDALQVATAIEAGCEAFVTNDVRLTRITEIRALAFDALEV